MLILASAELEVLNHCGFTPLAIAMARNKPDCAELFLDAGAKLTHVHESIKMPDWMRDIITKRQNVKRSLLVFMGMLRRRLVVPNAATAVGNRVPRDMVNLLAIYVWVTRFNHRWIEATPEPRTNASQFASGDNGSEQ